MMPYLPCRFRRFRSEFEIATLQLKNLLLFSTALGAL